MDLVMWRIWLFVLALHKCAGRTTGPPMVVVAEVLPHPKPPVAESRTNSDTKVTVHHRDGHQLTSTSSPDGHYHEISVSVTASNTTFTLRLLKNRYLFSSSYVEKIITSAGDVYNDVNQDDSHCYYTGAVSGWPESSAAVSTCHGVRGHFTIGKDIYSIEPIDGTLAGRHQVSRQSSSSLPSYKCGHSGEFSPTSSFGPLRRKKRAFQWPQDMDGQTKAVELYVVNDHAQFLALNRSEAAVIRRAKDVVNVVSLLYQPLDIYVVLVGIEVWANKDNIAVLPQNISQTLDSFSDYRRNYINPLHLNDNAHLISGVHFTNSLVGLAFVQTMCSYNSSVGLTSDIERSSTAFSGTVMAHEMGHNFGLNHDSTCTECTDVKRQCIMGSETSSRQPSTQWSECSKRELNASFNLHVDYCLYNMPETLYNLTAVCGNGIVETGEQCDCGKAPLSECNKACCNGSTCRLTSSSTCASGRCCDVTRCQVKPMSTICRPASGSCDLAEYCSGKDAICPSDVYLQDGTACVDTTGADAYCYGGRCRSHRYQCEMWWGSPTASASHTCYSEFNRKGDEFGHCGYGIGQLEYYPCNSGDALCGLLHCDADPRLMFFSQYETNIFMESYGSLNCTAASFYAINSGPQYPDPGLVPNGAKCGDGKMCLSQKCVAVTELNVVRCTDCNVCDNLGQCHCVAGSPDCSVSVYNPTSTSWRNAQTGTRIVACLVVLYLLYPSLLVAIL